MSQPSPQHDTFWSAPFDSLSVGQRFRSAERVVRDTDVIVFSALTGDWHPQHCDPEWAARGPFGERIAHGMLVLSLAVGLVPLDPERVVALRRVGDVVFKRPVRLNEAVYVAGVLTALRPIDDGNGLVEFTWQIRNHDDALVARASVQVLWSRAGEPARGTAGEPARDTAGDATQDAAGEAAPESWRETIAGDAAPDEFVPLPL